MLAPMASPELPSAMSYAVVLLSSPVYVSDRRAPLVSRRAQAGAGVGLTVCWATLGRVVGRRSFGPAQQ